MTGEVSSSNFILGSYIYWRTFLTVGTSCDSGFRVQQTIHKEVVFGLLPSGRSSLRPSGRPSASTRRQTPSPTLQICLVQFSTCSLFIVTPRRDFHLNPPWMRSGFSFSAYDFGRSKVGFSCRGYTPISEAKKRLHPCPRGRGLRGPVFLTSFKRNHRFNKNTLW